MSNLEEAITPFPSQTYEEISGRVMNDDESSYHGDNWAGSKKINEGLEEWSLLVLGIVLFNGRFIGSGEFKGNKLESLLFPSGDDFSNLQN